MALVSFCGSLWPMASLNVLLSTVLAVVFQFLSGAAKKWRILGGAKRMAEVVRGVTFVDGIQQERAPLLDAIHNI